MNFVVIACVRVLGRILDGVDWIGLECCAQSYSL
jgi:hypothetical protein